MLVDANSSVIVGRAVDVRDVPGPELVMNLTGTRSDPNFAGAYDRETIEYSREIDVEVVKIPFVAEIHPPEVFAGLSAFTVRTEVYECLQFPVVREERTRAMIKLAYDQRIKLHAEAMDEVRRSFMKGTHIYLMKMGRTMLEADAAPHPVYTQIEDCYSLRDVKKVIKSLPKGTFRKGPRGKPRRGEDKGTILSI